MIADRLQLQRKEGVNPFTSQSRFELIRDMNNLPSSE